MNFNIIKGKQPVDLTGGGYASQQLTIYIDSRMPKRKQRVLFIHEYLESLLWFLPHDKIDAITQDIEDGLDDLERI